MLGSYPKPIARVPWWLKKSSARMYKPAQDAIKHTVAPTTNQNSARPLHGPVDAGKRYLKAKEVTGEHLRQTASSFQPPARPSALSSGPEKLMGQEGAGIHAGQTYFGAGLVLLNVREKLCQLKEIDVGLGKIDLAINDVEISGLGQGVRGPFVPHVIAQKGKEKVGVEGKGPRPMRRFKAKKKVSFFKPKAGFGLGVGQGRGPGYSRSSGESPNHLGKS